MQIAILPGSLRIGSYNKKLGRVVQSILSSLQHESEFIDLKNFDISVYDGDVEEEKGIPPSVEKLSARIQANSALIIVSPEYNGSTPGVLKNTIDWLSRIEKHPLYRRPVLLLAASPGALGGIRALPITKQLLETLGAYAFPDTFALAKADQAFDENEHLKDPKTLKRLSSLIEEFIQYATRLS